MYACMEEAPLGDFFIAGETATLPVSTHYSNDSSFVNIYLWELD